VNVDYRIDDNIILIYLSTVISFTYQLQQKRVVKECVLAVFELLALVYIDRLLCNWSYSINLL